MDTLRIPTTVCVLLALLACVLTNFVHSASLDLPTDIQARGLNTVCIINLPHSIYLGPMNYDVRKSGCTI